MFLCFDELMTTCNFTKWIFQGIWIPCILMFQTPPDLLISSQRETSNSTLYICFKVKYIKTFSLVECIPCGEKKGCQRLNQNVLESGMSVNILC